MDHYTQGAQKIATQKAVDLVSHYLCCLFLAGSAHHIVDKMKSFVVYRRVTVLASALLIIHGRGRTGLPVQICFFSRQVRS
jgi:hypothetical protein